MAEPLRRVTRVDLSRYMGSWHVIANIPTIAERGCIDSVEHYDREANGQIRIRFSCRRKYSNAPLKLRLTLKASVVDTATNAEWRVWFFGLLPVRYLIIDLDTDYNWVVIGHSSRRYGWVMARTRALSPLTYQAILRRLGDQGYDVARFNKVPQTIDSSATVSAPS